MWIRAARFLLACACGAAILVPLGEEHAERVLPLRIEDVPLQSAGSRAEHGSESSSGESAHSRIVRLTSAEIDLETLAVDPDARRTWVVPSAPMRVLDPASLDVRALGPARLGRPLALLVRAAEGRIGDEIEVAIDGESSGELRMSRDDAGLFVRVEIPDLEAEGHRVFVSLSGSRDGRRGRVTCEAAITPSAAPRVALLGVAKDSAFARALQLQGFEVGDPDAPAKGVQAPPADLWLADISRPLPAGLSEQIDAGAGLVALARDGATMHPSWAQLLPVQVVELPEPEAEDRPSDAEPEDRESDSSTADARREPLGPAPPEDDGLRRVGELDESEVRSSKPETIAAKAVALVLLIDKSGSMTGPVAAPAIDQAKRAAIASAEALGEGDSFALVAFGTRADAMLELGPASRRNALRSAVSGLVADASATRAYLALSEAWAQLKRSDAPIRHVLLLTDGEFTDQEQNYRSMVRAMQREGIGISAIASTSGLRGGDALNVGKFRFLSRLLRTVGGSIRFGTSTEIPRLVLGEVREVLSAARPLREGGGRAAASEERAHAAKPDDRLAKKADKAGGDAGEKKQASAEKNVASASDEPEANDAASARHEIDWIDPRPMLLGIEGGGAWPALRGRLPLEAQARARVHLAFRGSGHVALATALHGLGRVVLWAGDDGALWARDFVADARFPALLAQLASWSQAPLDASAAEQSDDVEGRVGRLRILARRVAEGDGLTPRIVRAAAERVGAAPEDVVGMERARQLAIGMRSANSSAVSPLWRAASLLAALLALLAIEAWSARRQRRRPERARAKA